MLLAFPGELLAAVSVSHINVEQWDFGMLLAAPGPPGQQCYGGAPLERGIKQREAAKMSGFSKDGPDGQGMLAMGTRPPPWHPENIAGKATETPFKELHPQALSNTPRCHDDGP